jgi:general secretion pathway protein K
MARQPDQRGVALIVVLLMISIIIAVTLELNRDSRGEIYDAINTGDAVRLRYLAKSGFAAGEAFLLADRNGFDGLTEDWSKPERVLEKTGEDLSPENCRLAIEDDSGRIPLNKLVVGATYNQELGSLLIRLLSLPEFRLEQKQVHAIVDSLKDWLDADSEVTGEDGAEAFHYAALERPYPVKNAPLDCIEELLMVKGITKELLYGGEDTPGLASLVTLHGDGRININTAPVLVLRALTAEITEEMVGDMQLYRKSEDNDLSDSLWYHRVSGMSGVNINPNLITSKSRVFRITATGVYGNLQQTVTGVVRRDPDKKAMQLLSWRVQ